MNELNSKTSRNMALGLVLGIAFGAAIDNMGLGIALGVAIGAATGLRSSNKGGGDQ